MQILGSAEPRRELTDFLSSLETIVTDADAALLWGICLEGLCFCERKWLWWVEVWRLGRGQGCLISKPGFPCTHMVVLKSHRHKRVLTANQHLKPWLVT